MDDDLLIEKIAKLVKPDWFNLITDEKGNTFCLMDNYPDQHKRYQEEARRIARKILELVEKHKEK